MALIQNKCGHAGIKKRERKQKLMCLPLCQTVTFLNCKETMLGYSGIHLQKQNSGTDCSWVCQTETPINTRLKEESEHTWYRAHFAARNMQTQATVEAEYCTHMLVRCKLSYAKQSTCQSVAHTTKALFNPPINQSKN